MAFLVWILVVIVSYCLFSILSVLQDIRQILKEMKK